MCFLSVTQTWAQMWGRERTEHAPEVKTTGISLAHLSVPCLLTGPITEIRSVTGLTLICYVNVQFPAQSRFKSTKHLLLFMLNKAACGAGWGIQMKSWWGLMGAACGAQMKS